MEPTVAPFAGQVAQWGAVGVLVALLAFMSLTLWRTLQAERAAATARYDALLAILLKHMPDSIKADVENVNALKAVDASMVGMRSVIDLLARKVGA